MKKQGIEKPQEEMETIKVAGEPETIGQPIDETLSGEVTVKGTEQECDERISELKSKYKTEIIGVVNSDDFMQYTLLISKNE